jgi:hypothetical protein
MSATIGFADEGRPGPVRADAAARLAEVLGEPSLTEDVAVLHALSAALDEALCPLTGIWPI